MLEYKGYTGAVEFDDEAGLFHGRVLHLRDVITFQGTSVEELRHEFHESVDGYLEWCVERSEKPEKPFSGKVLLRMGPDLHQRAAIAAMKAKSSLNDWILRAMEQESNRAKAPVPISSALTIASPPPSVIVPRIHSRSRWSQVKIRQQEPSMSARKVSLATQQDFFGDFDGEKY